MASAETDLRASYAACQQVAREAGSNFHGSFLRLPREKRHAMDVLYAFMRHTDDLADSPEPAEQRREALNNWRTALDLVLREGPSASLPGVDPRGEALLPALAEVVARYGIPAHSLEMVIDGVEMDLTRRRFETFDELVVYCEHVASAVGLACIHIWGFSGPEALEPARQCGLALQWTNILRDLAEDAREDRIYLPMEDLRRFDYPDDGFLRGVTDDRFRRLMTLQTDRAEAFYREGAGLIHLLHPDGRRTFGIMMSVYRALLEKIRRRPEAVLQKRLRLSRPHKLRIALRWMLRPSAREFGPL